MTDNAEEGPRYKVIALKRAKDAGRKLLTDKSRLWLIRDLKRLAYWPETSNEFDHERAWGAVELKYRLEQKWIRIFVYPDDVRRVMWILHAFAKKTNELPLAQRIAVETAISRVEEGMRACQKARDKAEKMNKLHVVRGGKP